MYSQQLSEKTQSLSSWFRNHFSKKFLYTQGGSDTKPGSYYSPEKASLTRPLTSRLGRSSSMPRYMSAILCQSSQQTQQQRSSVYGAQTGRTILNESPPRVRLFANQETPQLDQNSGAYTKINQIETRLAGDQLQSKITKKTTLIDGGDQTSSTSFKEIEEESLEFGRKIETIYYQEVIPSGYPALTPLNHQEKAMVKSSFYTNKAADQYIKQEERKRVMIRRAEYANRMKGVRKSMIYTKFSDSRGSLNREEQQILQRVRSKSQRGNIQPLFNSSPYQMLNLNSDRISSIKTEQLFTDQEEDEFQPLRQTHSISITKPPKAPVPKNPNTRGQVSASLPKPDIMVYEESPNSRKFNFKLDLSFQNESEKFDYFGTISKSQRASPKSTRSKGSVVSKSPKATLLKSPMAKSPRNPVRNSPMAKSPRNAPIKSPMAKSPRNVPIKSPMAKSPRNPPIKSPMAKSPRNPPIKSPMAKSPRNPVPSSPMAKSPRNSVPSVSVGKKAKPEPLMTPRSSRGSRKPSPAASPRGLTVDNIRVKNLSSSRSQRALTPRNLSPVNSQQFLHTPRGNSSFKSPRSNSGQFDFSGSQRGRVYQSANLPPIKTPSRSRSPAGESRAQPDVIQNLRELGDDKLIKGLKFIGAFARFLKRDGLSYLS